MDASFVSWVKQPCAHYPFGACSVSKVLPYPYAHDMDDRFSKLEYWEHQLKERSKTPFYTRSSGNAVLLRCCNRTVFVNDGTMVVEVSISWASPILTTIRHYLLQQADASALITRHRASGIAINYQYFTFMAASREPKGNKSATSFPCDLLSYEYGTGQVDRDVRRRGTRWCRRRTVGSSS